MSLYVKWETTGVRIIQKWAGRDLYSCTRVLEYIVTLSISQASARIFAIVNSTILYVCFSVRWSYVIEEDFIGLNLLGRKLVKEGS